MRSVENDLGTDWPFLGRAAELERIGELYRRHGHGVVLVGAPGVGTTRLAKECLDLARSQGAATMECTATQARSDLPIGVFMPLLPSVRAGAANATDRLELVQRCREELLGASDGRVALLVDNAHLLDGVSKALVEQLAKTGDVFLIITVDDDAAGTEFVVSLWKNTGLERIPVEPLTDEWIDAVLSAVLGGPIDWATVRQLAEQSEGKPLVLRELILAADEDGVLRRDYGIWRLVGAVPTPRRFVDLVQSRMTDLSPEHRSLLELIAFGEPLRLSHLPDADPALLQDLERRGMIVSEKRAGDVVVRLAHHVYGLVLRDTVPTLRVSEIVGSLADSAERAGLEGPDDRLRVAAWRLEAGGSSADRMLAAAREAQARSDDVLADQLARRSLQLEWTFEAALLAAQLGAALGRREEAEAELEALASLAVDDEQQARIALSRMDNLVFSLGQIDRGLDLAERAESTIVDQDWKDELTGKRASVLAGVRGPGAAAALAVPLLDRARGRALVWGSMVSAYALGRTGELERARATTEMGRRVQGALEEPFDWPIWRHDFFDAEALAHEGHLTEARAASLALYRKAVDDGSVEAQAWFAWRLSMHVPDCGGPHTAGYYGRLAVALFRQLGRRQMEQIALAQVATAWALAGNPLQARAALDQLRDLGLAEARYFPVERLQAEAWTAAANSDPTAAKDALQAAAAVAREAGDVVGEAESLHALARIGALDDHSRLNEVAAHIDGRLAATRAAHARALHARDAGELDAVAAAFNEMGATLLAAEASAAASHRWHDLGRERSAAASERRAIAALRLCENPRSAVTLMSRSTARLTPAELRTAILAARGRTSREIADEFVVSIRTVQNQLQRVYEKLGIRSRSELAHALADHEV